MELFRHPAKTLDNGVYAVMANTRNKFTMQGVGSPVSAVGQGEKTGPQASSSYDRSFVEVASTEYKATRHDTSTRFCSPHAHDDSSKPNTFYYVCGTYQPPNSRKKISHAVIKAYKYCFGLEISNLDANWVPHAVCGTCYKMLTNCHNTTNLSHLKYTNKCVTIKGLKKMNEDSIFIEFHFF